MKLNKEKVYDFIKLHSADENSSGVATSYIAETLNMQRTNVSSILNQLVEEGRVDKTNGRPVLYYISRTSAGKSDCFAELIGHEGSLRHVVQLAKAAVLYPQKSLNAAIVGAWGTGKGFLARLIHRFAVDQEVLEKDAPFVRVFCHDYKDDDERFLLDMFGEQGNGGYWKQAENGVLYLDNVQHIGSHGNRRLLEQMKKAGKKVVVLIGCLDKKQIVNEDFFTEFPIMMELPPLAERPLTERLEMVNCFLSCEATHTKRTLIVKSDLMRCLLLYECEANYHQLQGDIQIGCANAYVREYKNQDEIQLFVGDFAHHVRKGFLHYRARRLEIDKLIPSDTTYTYDGHKMRVSEQSSGSIYEKLSRKASLLNSSGLDEEEIGMILSAEVERSFRKYHKELVAEVANKEQLSVLVDKDIIEMVESFLEEASGRLDRHFSNSVFYGLCLHINALVRGRHESGGLDKSQITDILANYKKEYLLSAELAEKIGKRYEMELPIEEIILITMFICYETPTQTQKGKPVVLVAFYGEGVAGAVAKTITGLTQMDNVFPFELAYETDQAETYETLKNTIARIHQGQGVFVMYDSSFMGDMLSNIEEELGILIRPIVTPILSMGIELVRKCQTESNADKVYQEVMKNFGDFAANTKRYIVTLCTTGKGGAEELKNYIERYGKLKDTQVIPLSISNTEELRKSFKKLMRTGTIQCVVGTFNPNLFSIPFLSVAEVFGTPKQHIPNLLNMEKEAKSGIDYNAMYEYLEEQLEHVDIKKLNRVLPEVLENINQEIAPLSLDVEVGLMIHLACCIDRLSGRGVPTVNPRKKMILEKYQSEFQKLLKVLKPIEKTFRIILNDDEMANILTIIYQI